MMEIREYRAAKCVSCNEKAAAYAINGAPEFPERVCHDCMLGLLRAHEKVRNVLLLQGATRE
jgi:hypothetical protein